MKVTIYILKIETHSSSGERLDYGPNIFYSYEKKSDAIKQFNKTKKEIETEIKNKEMDMSDYLYHTSVVLSKDVFIGTARQILSTGIQCQSGQFSETIKQFHVPEEFTQ